MKVFWSWQSDRRGKTNRHVIKRALEKAISELNEKDELREPGEDRELQLDHDTKGMPGMPEIAATVMEKIDSATVFVAEVTPVARTDNGKDVMNPNVALELGYAMHRLKAANCLGVFNTHFGEVKDVPFDIQHRRWPITFRLSDDATKTEIEAAEKSLVASFKIALAAYLPKQKAEALQPQDFVGERPFFAPAGFILAHYDPDTDYALNHRPSIYLRMSPASSLNILRSDIIESVAQLGSFGQKSHAGLNQMNELGACKFDFDAKHEVLSMTQLFPTGEIWALNHYLVEAWMRYQKPVYATALSRIIYANLKRYIGFYSARGMSGRFVVEAGISGVKDKSVYPPGFKHEAKILDDLVFVRKEMDSGKDETLKAFTSMLIEKLYESSAQKVPEEMQQLLAGDILAGDRQNDW